jgi:hypothetical protein
MVIIETVQILETLFIGTRKFKIDYRHNRYVIKKSLKNQKMKLVVLRTSTTKVKYTLKGNKYIPTMRQYNKLFRTENIYGICFE